MPEGEHNKLSIGSDYLEELFTQLCVTPVIVLCHSGDDENRMNGDNISEPGNITLVNVNISSLFTVTIHTIGT